jgi:beta-galactosidase
MNVDKQISRRKFLQITTAATVTAGAVWSFDPSLAVAKSTNGPATLSFSLDQNWLFCPRPVFTPQPEESYEEVTLPHCVAKLSWEKWDAKSWQSVWAYRRNIIVPTECKNRRVFVKFSSVQITTKPSLNGRELEPHYGGYLPFTYELTDLLKPDNNILDVMADATWQNVPPEGNPKGTSSVDYYEPGGITRSVTLLAVPQVFISDVFAKPVDVLKLNRRVEVHCTVDAAVTGQGHYELRTDLLDGSLPISSVHKSVDVVQGQKTEFYSELTDLSACRLWEIDKPQLYTVVTTLLLDGKPLHDYRTRIGFREASFTPDGFYLNERKLMFFGLDRHEIYPYVGEAMPPRVIRHDAEIIRNDFNCNIVRCSHYPQNEAFLDACDELGLMVWEETPGWGYLGHDEEFQNRVYNDVHDMVLRDRNHASVVIWGVRVNESRTDPALYKRTTDLAKQLDGSKPCSGSMTSLKPYTTNWHEDVYSMDDYHNATGGGLAIYPPLPGIAYMLSETVGQRSYDGTKGFHNLYYRGGDVKIQMAQAIYHAEAHDRAAAYPRFNGVIAWCAFEYPSPSNSRNGIKNPGVSDLFRLPKLGASFYLAQIDPKVRPIIAPNFYWDFGPNQPSGPGKHVAIFSNCDRLEFFVNEKHLISTKPDGTSFMHTKYPPFFVDLELDGSSNPELRIDGYVGSNKLISRKMSSNKSHDQFFAQLEDEQLVGDGADATRLVFKIADKYCNDRQFGGGKVTFALEGPGVLVGKNSFDLAEAGGVGAVWIKTKPNSEGKIKVTAIHDSLGKHTFFIPVEPYTSSHLA